MQREGINISIYSVSLSPIHKFTYSRTTRSWYSCVFLRILVCLFVSLCVSSCLFASIVSL